MIRDNKVKDQLKLKELKGIKNKQDTLIVKAQMDFEFENFLSSNTQLKDLDWLESISLKKELNSLLLSNSSKESELKSLKQNIETFILPHQDTKPSLPSQIHNNLNQINQKHQIEIIETSRLLNKIQSLQDKINSLQQQIKTENKNSEIVQEKLKNLKEQKNFLHNAAKISKSKSSKFQVSRSTQNSEFDLNFTVLNNEMSKLKYESMQLCSKIAEKRSSEKEKGKNKLMVINKLKSEIDKSDKIQLGKKGIKTKLNHFEFYFSKVARFLGIDEKTKVTEYIEDIICWIKSSESRAECLALHFNDKSNILKKLKSEYKQIRYEKDHIVIASKFVVDINPGHDYIRALNDNYENLILRTFSNLNLLIKHQFNVIIKVEKISVLNDLKFSQFKEKLLKLTINDQTNPKQLFKKNPEAQKIFNIFIDENDSLILSPLINFYKSSHLIESTVISIMSQNFNNLYSGLHFQVNKDFRKKLNYFKDLLLLLKDYNSNAITMPSQIPNSKSTKYLSKLRATSRSSNRVSFISSDDLKNLAPGKSKYRKSEFSYPFLFPDINSLNSMKNSGNNSLSNEINIIDDKLHTLKIIKKRISAQNILETSPLRFPNKYLAKNNSSKRLYQVPSINKLSNLYSNIRSRKSSC